MEVELGNIAKTNAGSEKVKAFGEQMVSDHSKANDELKAIAISKSISLPSSPDKTSQQNE
jgi:putative membrane protein